MQRRIINRERWGRRSTSYGSYHFDSLVFDCLFCTRINFICQLVSKSGASETRRDYHCVYLRDSISLTGVNFGEELRLYHRISQGEGVPAWESNGDWASGRN